MGGIVTRQDGAILYITMSSPPVNAYSVEFLTALLSAVRSAEPGTGAVVLSSSADRVFAAGGDLKYMASIDERTSAEYVQLCQETYGAFEDPAFVSIAAIDGACLGGGLECALAFDVRVASPSSRLGLPEVTLGILAGGGAIHRLVRAVGQSVARDMLITGEPVSGDQAHQWGLVTRLVDDPLAEAVRIAERVAALAPEAVAATKELAFGASTDEMGPGLDKELARWLEVRRGANSQEGLSAFAERRVPQFSRTP
jgi:enoyl-CoA hydratase/carnithine racemase